MSGAGSLVIAGLGPAGAQWLTPEVSQALEAATDIIGYGPYAARLSLRPDQRVHASDNRVEILRAREALALAAAGRRVAVVSGGDPGVFAMAAAVFEALEAGDPPGAGLICACCPASAPCRRRRRGRARRSATISAPYRSRTI